MMSQGNRAMLVLSTTPLFHLEFRDDSLQQINASLPSSNKVSELIYM